MTPLQRYLEPDMLRELASLSISARTVAAGITTGQHRTPARGSSIEFRQHRFYSPGDEPRRIDWRVVARTDRVFIREYEQETNLRCLLLLDASGSMAYGAGRSNKLLYARRTAAALAYLMLSQTESVGLATFGSSLQYVPPHAGKAQLARLLTALDRTVTTPTGSPALFANAAAAVANRLARRTLVILLSDLFTEPADLARGLSRLRHDRHEVLILRILHLDEVTFPFKRASRFSGLEGELPRLVEPATLKAAYLARFQQHTKGLELAAQSLHTPLHTVDTTAHLPSALRALIAKP